MNCNICYIILINHLLNVINHLFKVCYPYKLLSHFNIKFVCQNIFIMLIKVSIAKVVIAYFLSLSSEWKTWMCRHTRSFSRIVHNSVQEVKSNWAINVCLESSQCTFFVLCFRTKTTFHIKLYLFQTKTHFHVFLDKPKYIFIYSPRAVHMIWLVDSWFSEEPSTKGCFENTFINILLDKTYVQYHMWCFYCCHIKM